MGIGGAWSSSTASEVGLGTGAGAGARSGTGLGSTLVEDGDSQVPVAAGRVGGSDHCCQKERGKRATKQRLEQKRLRHKSTWASQPQKQEL